MTARGQVRTAVAGLVLAAVVLTGCSSGQPLGSGSRPMGGEDSAALPRLSVKQADVPVEYTVSLWPQGDRVEGQVTLDLCAASFASERLRVARRQMAVVDSQERLVLSTEAVGYQSAAATEQAFGELRDAQARCPQDYVPSANGTDSFKTQFLAAPDTGWATVPGVQRLAFDIIITNQDGARFRSIVTYHRRGRILLGVYFFFRPDDALPSIAGQDTVEGVTNAFATRLSQLPAQVVGG